jgi:GNAT superfamily N-acetyltransferase
LPSTRLSTYAGYRPTMATSPADCPIFADYTECTHHSRDGASYRVRPISPDDGDALLRFHASLSDDTTRLRFFGVHPYLSRREKDRFINVDHKDRDALVALVGDDIIGVGRYERLDDRDDAEVAFVVTDQWQGRGVGSALFRHIAQRARAVGVRRLLAETFIENRRMLDVFAHSGSVISRTSSHGLVSVTMTLDPQ